MNLRARRESHARGSTGWRFLLLTVLVVAASVQLYDAMLMPPVTDPSDLLGCALAAGYDPEAGSLSMPEINGTTQQRALVTCIGEVPSTSDHAGFLPALGLLVVAAGVYWWLPLWRDRRGGTLPVEALDADGSLIAELDGMRAGAGVDRRRVRFRVDPARTMATALTYGRTGHYTVVLHAGLLVRRPLDPGFFRTVVLHELAHVRHRDVDFAYAGTALWRVFTLLALLPYLVEQVAHFVEGLSTASSSPFWPAGLRLNVAAFLYALLLALIVHLARAQLLRQRELYADARALAWGASRDSWDLPEADAASGARVRWAARRVRALHTHPGWAERRAALGQPWRVGATGPVDLFFTGAAGILLEHDLVTVPEVSASVWLQGTTVVTVALVAPVLWLAVRPRPGTGAGRGVPGLAAGLGLGTGLLAAELATSLHLSGWSEIRPVYLLFFLVIGTLPAVWAACHARLVAALVQRTARIVLTGLVCAVMVCLLFGTLDWWAADGRWLFGGAGGNAPTAETFARHSPGTWAGFPVERVALEWQRTHVVIFKNHVVQGAALLLTWILPVLLLPLALSGSRARRTLLMGVSGGLMSWAALAAALLYLRQRRPASLPERIHGVYVQVHLVWTLGAVVAATALTAAAAAAYFREHPVPRALAAAGIAQALALAGTCLVYGFSGCLGPLTTMTEHCGFLPHTTWNVVTRRFPDTLMWAASLSVCASIGGATAGHLVRRHGAADRSTAPDRPAPQPSGHARTRAVTATAALACMTLAVILPTLYDAVNSPPSFRSQPPIPVVAGTPTTAHSDITRRLQLIAWGRHGGLAHAATLLRLHETMAEALPDRTRHRIAATQTLCAALGKEAAEAQRYFWVPDPEAHRTWSAALRGLIRGSRDCRTALDNRDWDAFGRCLDTLTTAFSGIRETTDLVTAMVKIEYPQSSPSTPQGNPAGQPAGSPLPTMVFAPTRRPQFRSAGSRGRPQLTEIGVDAFGDGHLGKRAVAVHAVRKRRAARRRVVVQPGPAAVSTCVAGA